MTEDDAKAEGYSSLAEFRKEWPLITKQPLDLQEVVTAYEFHKTEKQQESNVKP
jgi:hypothetical protein